MNDLEMCKEIAKLEELEIKMDELFEVSLVSFNGSCWFEYNPITDLALNCALRDKHEVNIVNSLNYMCADKPIHHGGYTEFSLKKDIPRAVIECILKANGLYVEAGHE